MKAEIQKNCILHLANAKGTIANIWEDGTIEINQAGKEPEAAEILYRAIAEKGVKILSKRTEELEKELLLWKRVAEIMSETAEFWTESFALGSKMTPEEALEIFRHMAEKERKETRTE